VSISYHCQCFLFIPVNFYFYCINQFLFLLAKRAVRCINRHFCSSVSYRLVSQSCLQFRVVFESLALELAGHVTRYHMISKMDATEGTPLMAKDEHEQELPGCGGTLACDPRRNLHRYLVLILMCLLSFGMSRFSLLFSYFQYEHSE